jgi:hypothetical protein
MLYGVGNANDYFSWNEAGKNGVELRLQSEATSGDSRGEYVRMKFTGAGAGEVARFFATASAANVATGGTVNGVHATMSIDAACSVSGAGNAMRATLGAAAESRTLSGALSALQLDSDIGTGNTLPTIHAFMRFTNTGAVALSHLAQIPAAANGTMFAAHITQAMTHSIRIIDATGTPYYIMCASAATNRS